MTDEIRPKDLALECPTEYGHHHAAHVGGGDGVLEQQQGDGDHGDALGHVGHGVGEGGDQLQQGEGKQVLEPVQAPVHRQQHAHLAAQLARDLGGVNLQRVYSL